MFSKPLALSWRGTHLSLSQGIHFLTITMRALYQENSGAPFQHAKSRIRSEIRRKIRNRRASAREQGWSIICNAVGIEAPGWCMTESTPNPFSWLLFWPLVSHPMPNRIPTIPTLGCISSWSQVANWKPLEEIHIGIQTPEHLAKPNPAGLRMRHRPPLEPQPFFPCQWPALPLLDKRSLPTHLFHTDVQTRTSSPYVLTASQRVIFFKSCSKT